MYNILGNLEKAGNQTPFFNHLVSTSQGIQNSQTWASSVYKDSKTKPSILLELFDEMSMIQFTVIWIEIIFGQIECLK